VKGFFLGFPGRKVQSVLSFLKGKTSRFFLHSSLSVLIQLCLGKITFSPSCKFFVLYLGYVCTLMSMLSEHWIFH
jgi:hypothetical protein